MAGRITEQVTLVGYVDSARKGRISQQVALVARLYAQPLITLINPDSGDPADEVVITGESFGAAQGNGTVTFGGVGATVSSWSATSITCTVPSTDEGACDVVVTTNGGMVSPAFPFTVTASATQKTVTDTGAGADDLLLDKYLIPDTGAGTDAVTVQKTYAIAETGAGADSIRVQRREGALPGVFCFAAGHGDAHPYMVYTLDLYADSPTWVNNTNGLIDRALPGAEALRNWVMDPDAPRDCAFGITYTDASSGNTGIWRNTDIRNNGSWAKVFDINTLISATGDSGITSCLTWTLNIQPGILGAMVRANHTNINSDIYFIHTHDRGDTWTATRVAAGLNPYGQGAGVVIGTNGLDIFVAHETRDFWNHTYGWKSSNGGHSFGGAITLNAADWFLYGYQGTAAPQTMYLTPNDIGGAAFRRTTDGGTNWSSPSPPFAGNAAIAGAPDNADVVAYYNSNGSRVYYSSNGGTSWTILPDTYQSNRARIVSLVDQNRLIVETLWYWVWEPHESHIQTITVGDSAWVTRDGNLATVCNNDPTFRFCAVIGVDPSLVSEVNVSDNGSGTEVLEISVTLQVSDSGAGLDDPDIFQQTLFKTLADLGISTDDLLVTVEIVEADSGSGAETVSAQNAQQYKLRIMKTKTLGFHAGSSKIGRFGYSGGPK